MTDFLLELRSEEIPARMQVKAREDLARLFAAELAKAGIVVSDLTTYATPRRLTLIARDLPAETAAVSEETKGPKTSAPPQALEGFLRKTGLTREQLVERDGILYAVIDKPGRATADVLADAIPAIVRAFPWPKSMRWGDASASTESLRWVRPLQGIVALFGDAVVRFEIAGVASGNTTVGHRFHAPAAITLTGADDYVEQLRAAHVIVDQHERRHIIALGSMMAARKAGLALVEDEGLLIENAGLTEWPMPLLGRFDAAFLGVPPEVIQLTARVNQKYFVCRDGDGKLANAFICTADIDASDGGDAIVEGNRKVLAARLSDAKFFYDTDLKVPLEEQAKKLDRIVFHDKLGTVADKVDRVAKLARWLVEEGIVGSNPVPATNPISFPGEGRGPVSNQSLSGDEVRSLKPAQLGPGLRRESDEERAALAAQAERAALLCKADLVTGMVGEFPELQGLMGGYYAAAQGKDPAIAAAIRDHYKPVGQGDEVPTDPLTVAVSLADKLDTLFSFFAIDEKPTGSKDPFALRRAGLAVIALIVQADVRLSFTRIGERYLALLANHIGRRGLANDSMESFADEIYNDWLIARPFQRNEDGSVFRVQESDSRISYSNELAPLMRWAADVHDFVMASAPNLLPFLTDRLKVQQRDAGVRHDLIDAVFALGGEDDLVRLLARVRALQSFIGTPDGANLLAGYKRAANILKKEGWAVSAPLPARASGEQRPALFRSGWEPDRPDAGPGVGAVGEDGGSDASVVRDPAGRVPTPGPSLAAMGEVGLSYSPEIAETALMTALDSAEPRARAAIDAEDFESAMAALATLRAPIDAFFETVTVNDPDRDKRSHRLALLARVRAAVHNVADFSKIEG